MLDTENKLKAFILRKTRVERKYYDKNFNSGLELAFNICKRYNFDYLFAKPCLLNELAKSNKNYWDEGKSAALIATISFLRSDYKNATTSS